MSTPKTYTFDVDTKRYINNVNTYRLLNGLPNISNSDAADIDNFVVGLKDLGVWDYMCIWLYSPNYNSIIDRRVIPLNTVNYNYLNQTGILSTTVSSDPTGCIFPLGSTITGPFFLVDPIEITVGFVGTMPTSGGRGNWITATGIRLNGVSDNALIWCNPRTGFGGEFRFAGSNASLAENTLTGFNSWIYTGKLGARTIIYRNGSLAATAPTDASLIPYNSQQISLSFCRNGTYIGTASLCFIAKLRFSGQQVASINRLIKDTVGKNLSLP